MRLIDADAEFLVTVNYGGGLSGCYRTTVAEYLGENMNKIPTIDAVPVVHGEWIWDIDGMDWGIGSWKCKNCHARPNTYWQCDSTINPLTFAGSSYCPNCGANMDGEQYAQY